MTAIWAELLGTTSVDRHQSFFALGGDSLLATRLVEKIRRITGIDLSLRQLLAMQTIAKLAAGIAGQQAQLTARETEEGIL
jgi:acyl carrier protein